MSRFEKVKTVYDGQEVEGIEVPCRATKGSAGYDISLCVDVVIPSLFVEYFKKALWLKRYVGMFYSASPVNIDQAKKEHENMVLNKIYPTGITVKLDEDEVLMIVPRSSIGLKGLLTLPNNVGVIDSDYYPNSIGLNFINYGFKPVIIPKGTKVAQGIIMKYRKTEDDMATDERTGGFGSTTKP